LGKTGAAIGELGKRGKSSMLKKFGSLIFFILIIIAALGVANFLAITFYETSLVKAIQDFFFVLNKK